MARDYPREQFEGSQSPDCLFALSVIRGPGVENGDGRGDYAYVQLMTRFFIVRCQGRLASSMKMRDCLSSYGSLALHSPIPGWSTE